MISAEHLVQQLTSTNFKKIALPRSERFTQCDCYEAKKREMDLAIMNVEAINRSTDLPNLTTAAPVASAMEKAYANMMLTNVDGMLAVEKLSTATIDYDTYMNFSENELITCPEVVQRILKADSQKTLDRVKIYGFKNPESFYKSLILVRSPEFATQTKFNRTQTIMKFKRELAFGANDVHRTHEYHRLVDPIFKLDQMVRNLIDRESYVDNALCQLACDFVKRSIIVFDMVGKKYNIFRHAPSVSANNGTIGEAYFVINYNGSYSPCLYVDTHNTFDGQALASELSKQYEHANPTQYELNEKDTGPRAPRKPERSANAEPRIDLLVKKVEDRERERNVIVVTECPMAPPASASTSKKKTKSSSPTGSPSHTADDGIGPIKNYTLEQLQALATEKGIEITKPNAKGNPIRKTKQVLYDEITGTANQPVE